MLHTYAAKCALAALTVLALCTGAASAAPTVPDAEAQLDVIARSHALKAEIDTVRIRSRENMTAYKFCAAVTDLDGDGRLELLISRRTLSYEPLLRAGNEISEEQKEGLTELAEMFPRYIHGAAYEINADGTRLVPLDIVDSRTSAELPYEGGSFPDLMSIHVRPTGVNGTPVYLASAARMTGESSVEDGQERYGIVGEGYTIQLEGGALIIAQTSITKGTAGVYGAYVEPYYTWSQDLVTGRTYDPSSIPPESRRTDDGPTLDPLSWEYLERNPYEALTSSWYSWTHDGATVRG